MGPAVRRQVPYYQQIADDYRSRIDSGELAEGATLPSFIDIAKDSKVTRETVKRAMELLAREGWVLVRHGAKTVVTRPQTVKAEPLVAGALGIAEGSEVRMQVSETAVVFTRI